MLSVVFLTALFCPHILWRLFFEKPAEDLEKVCGTFCADWLKTEEVWSRFLRSDRLEQITVTASRLPTYAHYAQRSEVAAGLCEIRVLLQEVLAFELPDLTDLA